MKNTKIISIAVAILLCIVFYLILPGKDPIKNSSLKSEDLIGSKCFVSYGSTTSPASAHGLIKLINDRWVLLLVQDESSKEVSYNEYWIPFHKITHIIKANN